MNSTDALYRKALETADAPVLRDTVAAVAADPATFGRLFYRRLFDHAPAVRTMFPLDTTSQEGKLADTVLVLVGHLHDLGELTVALRELGERHRRYGAQTAHYQAVGNVLIDTLAEVNGPRFDARARKAWVSLYRWTVSAMEPVAVV